MSEGLFNFVIAWTLMFAPLLYTDKRRDKFKGSIDVLWGFQMFLTNSMILNSYLCLTYIVFKFAKARRKQLRKLACLV